MFKYNLMDKTSQSSPWAHPVVLNTLSLKSHGLHVFVPIAVPVYLSIYF